MKFKKSEKGQALILIVLAAVVLFGFAGLTIDGSNAFSDKRHAQNAADTAAFAGALAYSRGNDINTAAQDRATSNGYDGLDKSDVTITVTDTPAGICPVNTTGKDIKVDIVSYVNTTIARVIGQTQIINRVSATARSCGSYYGPPFNGNAIVSLAPSGNGFDAHGTPDWNITGGGIMVNSSDSSAATCGGAAGVNAPSVTAVGGTSMGGCYTGPTPTTGATQINYASYSSLFPRQPSCNGTASLSGGQYHPEAGADGSKVAWTGDQDFAPGLYCVTNSPGPFHGSLSGSEVTFYIMSSNFSMKFNGGGNLTASAPTSGEYKGVLLYLAPQVNNGNLLNTQALDMRGNGSGDVTGTIIAPSATVTMFGNSGTGAFDSQVIGYNVDTGGNADITVAYQANDNLNASFPITLTLLK
jgi:Flp pilus assembly protein TadG